MHLGSGFHVIPVSDLVKHDLSPDCVCGPDKTSEPDKNDSRIIHFIFTHHALDGRNQPDRKKAA